MALIDDIRGLVRSAGAKILAVDWNKMIDGIVDAMNRSSTAQTTANTAITRINNIKKGRTLLWTGTAYTTGTNLNLTQSVDNFDCIMVELSLQGIQYIFTDFKDTANRSFRDFNLSDSTTTTTNMFEINVKRITDTQLQITGNKKQDMANGANTWSTPIMDNEGTYIRNIWGINFN